MADAGEFFYVHDAEEVEYRYAAAWRVGRLVGIWEAATVMLAVRPLPKDEEVAVPMDDGWRRAIRWGRFLGTPDHFVLVAPESVRIPDRAEGKYMERAPHRCPRCGAKALIMTTKVSCTGRGCPNFDLKA